MRSVRLPGKVLRDLAGKPMLDRVVERLQRLRGPHLVVLATSDLPVDDEVAERAAGLGMPVFRGSESDVLDRFARCAAEFDLNPVVRATADNPFVDPEEGDSLLRFFSDRGLDYAANISSLGGQLPIGVGLEVFARTALEAAWRESSHPAHREHVNGYIHENGSRFRRATPPTPAAKRAPHVRLTVDTADDLLIAQRMIADYAATHDGDECVPTEWLVSHHHRYRPDPSPPSQ